MKHVFEIVEKDAAARIGKIFTKHGIINTPYFFPVVNIHVPVISPEDLRTLGYNAFITNAYTIWRDEKLHTLALENGIHKLFGNWQGPIMTDSGAYQLSVYGDVEVSNVEIVKFQNDIGVDIGVILDVPLYTGDLETRKKAIDETIRRAQEACKSGFINEESEIIWVGPLHGNPIETLLEYSAREMLKFPFKMYALGSLVPYVEEYQIYQLVRSALFVKQNFPSNYPLHLFGVGHPMTFSFFVLLGFDTFDSALYALAAKDGRYLTTHGTYNIKRMEYFPCSCPVCTKYSPKELLEMVPIERQHHLAMHNLYVIMAELKRIKQSIWEGTLWELVAQRASSHPELARAYNLLLSGKDAIYKFFELYEPTFKRRGILITRPEEINLPAVLRYKSRMKERIFIWSDKLIVTTPRGAHKLPTYLDAQVMILDDIFCLIPREIRMVYPLFQHISYRTAISEDALRWTKDTIETYLLSKFKEVYIYDENKEYALKLRDYLGFGEIYTGQDVGVIPIEKVRLYVTKAMLKFQFGQEADSVVEGVKFEYSRTTGVLRKIYATDVREREERIIQWELEEIVKDKIKKGEEVPEDPYQELFVNRGRTWLMASLVAESFKIVPQPLLAYRLWEKFKDKLQYSIILKDEAEPFVRDGKSIFSKFVVDVDPQIRASDEVLVLNENRDLIALGRAVIGAKEMLEFKRGIAAKNRRGIQIKL
ncbi:MAG: tRNA guanosine(15) transglycosylase TgtA [Candidatus Korarchaeota archaeon]|nr:tRNA guanosine(15) transglycosylase TgtA [Thermoproteota archaeon]